MAISTYLLHLLVLQVVMVSAAAAAGAGSGGDDFSWMPNGGCVECMGAGEIEIEMAERRILTTTNYISYGALPGNNVPCSQRGASYYNCQSGAEANPYQRGCGTITRCQR